MKLFIRVQRVMSFSSDVLRRLTHRGCPILAFSTGGNHAPLSQTFSLLRGLGVVTHLVITKGLCPLRECRELYCLQPLKPQLAVCKKHKLVVARAPELS